MESKGFKVRIDVNEPVQKEKNCKRYQAYEAAIKKIKDNKEK